MRVVPLLLLSFLLVHGQPWKLWKAACFLASAAVLLAVVLTAAAGCSSSMPPQQQYPAAGCSKSSRTAQYAATKEQQFRFFTRLCSLH
jgi:hypothetical protein